MEIFLISFIIYLLTAFAIGIGIMFRGQAMHAGCRGGPGKLNCKYKSTCSGQCRRIK